MIIQSKKVYYHEKLQPKQIEIKDDRIIGVYDYNQFPVDKDYGELLITPGLCDIHNHGYHGNKSDSATKEWLDEWTSYLPSEGVTSTLVSISAYPKDELIKGLKNTGEYIDNYNTSGTHLLGVYEEGPFICNTKEKGAQDDRYMIIPTKEVIDEFNDACNGHLIYVMIAPEMLKGDYSVIDYCVSKGMKVSLGHTGATFDICQEAIKHGARSFTHTYNGMRGLHHREPGVVGAAMYNDECWCELICDGLHVNKIAANILARIKGKDKICLITDSIQLKGYEVGEYQTSEGNITITDKGVCYITGTDTLSGSCHKLSEILNYAIKEAKIDIVTAINGATINPMRMLCINDRGLIKEGYKADIAVFDEGFNNIDTYIDGKLYRR